MHECKIHNVLTKAFINEECRYWATHLYIHITYIYFILPAVMSYIYCSIVFRQLSDTFVNSTFSADEYNIFTIAIIYTLICVCVCTCMWKGGGGIIEQDYGCFEYGLHVCQMHFSIAYILIIIYRYL